MMIFSDIFKFFVMVVFLAKSREADDFFRYFQIFLSVQRPAKDEEAAGRSRSRRQDGKENLVGVMII